ncbi:MAG: DUF5680 domain-containing protein [Planctomycetes bacterium]|jgi:hypothetical protein|nr:DUF5680 domain-containing protein [Planctomycetota bacterium]
MKKKIDFSEALNKLWEARNRGYAGGGVYTKLISGEKIFRHGSRTGYSYEDRYLNLFSPQTFAGEEILLYKDAYLWRMIYAGGILFPYGMDKDFTDEVYQFLKHCLCIGLKLVPRDDNFLPRGPISHMGTRSVRFRRKYGFLHYNYSSSNFNFHEFDGRERIIWNSPRGEPKVVFIHMVQGGLIG